MSTSSHAAAAAALIALVSQHVEAQQAQTFTPETIVQFAKGGDKERAMFSQIPPLAPLVKGDFGIGVADFNDDGTKEIVLLSLTCDNAGCPLVVLQNNGGQTGLIFAKKVSGRVALTKEKINGYHAIAAADKAGAIMTDAATGKQIVYPVGANAPAVAGNAPKAAGTPAAPAPAASSNAAPANSPAAARAAALLKSIPDISAGGFHLGMPREKAIAELKSEGLLNDPTAKPEIGFAFKQLPGQSFVGGSSGVKYGTTPAHMEQVFTTYTTEPTTPVLVGIQRTVRYDRPERPTVANTLAALREKYGSESGTGTRAANDLYWLFDAQGHPFSSAQVAAQAKFNCLQDYELQLGDPALAIARGYAETFAGTNTQGQSNPDAGCFDMISVHAVLQIDDGNTAVGITKAADWAAHGNGFVNQIVVTVRDLPLEYSASQVTRAAVVAGGEQQDQQQLDAAKKNKPVL